MSNETKKGSGRRGIRVGESKVTHLPTPATLEGEMTPSLPSGADVATMLSERELVVELQALVKQGVAIHYEVGRRLCELKEHTEHGRFMQILQTDLWGFSIENARIHMLFFRKCNEFPQLRHFADGNYTKAVTLFNGLDNEELAQIEEGSHEITIDKLDTLSVSGLKKEIKRLQKPLEEVVKEETKAITAERDAAIQERDAALSQLKAETPETFDIAWKAVGNKLRELTSAMDRLMEAAGPNPDDTTRAQVQAQLASVAHLTGQRLDTFLAGGAAE
ncbi:hypothetical protein [Endothiovibrio diazotrophicus]